MEKVEALFYKSIMSIIFLVNIIPLLWVVRTAFVSKRHLMDLFTISMPTFENFRSIFSAAPFQMYYLNTMIVILGVFCIQFFFITLSGYAFARIDFYGKNFLFVLFLIQILITPDVLILPNYRFVTWLNLVDTRLGIMIPYFASSFGIFLMRQNFKQLPVELEEAAEVEGLSTWGILWKICVPLSKPAYIAFGIVSVSYHWNNFLWPLVVTNSVHKRTLSLGLAIFAQSYETGAQWGEVSAATVAVVAPLLLLFLLFERNIMDSFTRSGIK